MSLPQDTPMVDAVFNGIEDSAAPFTNGDPIEELATQAVQDLSIDQHDAYDASRSGLCYDARMRFHGVINPMDDHPEDPRRIYRIYQALEGAGLTSITSLARQGRDTLRRIPAREAQKEEVLLVHNLEHWESMLATADMTYDQLMKLGMISDSMYFNNESFYCARLACGGAIETCKAVVTNKVRNGIAVIRPPGHHAEPEIACGFCLFNNVSVAVKVTMRNHPQIRKVLILDWDVHHGNGTQTAFYDDPNVLFISIHRYENATFFPGSPYANLDKSGTAEGLGKTVNIPWPTAGMGDADYIYAFEKIVMPISREFDPDLVLISAGFDAAAGDPLGECFVTPPGYSHITHQLMSLAGGKVVTCLEGGYNLQAISDSALAVTKTLMGEALPRLAKQEPSRRAIETIHRVSLEQSKYWRCMAPLAFNHNPVYNDSARLHDVVRSFQATKLTKKYGMIPLPLLEDRASVSFKDQAFSTPNFLSSEVLLLYIHDAPEVWTNPTPDQSRISTHESYLPDSASLFLDWAMNQQYAVIDVNVPAALTGIDEEKYNVQDETARLAKYIWDNYIELSDAKHIIFLAVGQACPGLTSMISMKDVTRRVSAVISFYGRIPLKALISVEDTMIDWYYANSLCFTTDNNECWLAPKRPKRKFGKAVRGNASELDELVHASFARAIEFLVEQLETQD